MLSSYFDLRPRRLQEERRREDEERRREECRQDAEAAERRHQELMAALIAVLSNGRGQDTGQSELIRTLQQTIEDLRAENERLRREYGNGETSQPE